MSEQTTIRLRDRRSYPVLYMFAITFVATGVLIGLSHLTSSRVDANRQVLFERAVLLALGWSPEQKMSPRDVHEAFLEHVNTPSESTAGAYCRVSGGTVTAYALPFEGQGFWNVIKGVIGIKPDGSSLTGLAFYEQNETPGLGAEITKPHFTDQFRDLKLDHEGAALGLKAVGTSSSDNEVDAITGATQTCTRLEDILNDALERWRKEMGLHRSGGNGSVEKPGDAQ